MSELIVIRCQYLELIMWTNKSSLSHEGEAPCTKCIIETNWKAVDSVFHSALEFPSFAISKLIHYATGLAMVFA